MDAVQVSASHRETAERCGMTAPGLRVRLRRATDKIGAENEGVRPPSYTR